MKKILLLFTFFLTTVSNSFADDNQIIELAQKVFNKWSHKSKKHLVIIVDFSKPIETDRFYIVDVKTKSIILRTIVSHGKGSGKTSIPTSFSNTVGTLASSKGVMVTAESYQGTWGYSMKLDGLQKCNSNVRKRSIVIHDMSVQKTHFSWGCFSVPKEIYRRVIDLTKGGSLLFAFSNSFDDY